MAFIPAAIVYKGRVGASRRLSGRPSALNVRLAVAVYLKKLKWSEHEDRTAYQALPATWKGEFGSYSPLDERATETNVPVKSEVFGQAYEAPVALELRAEDEEAFRQFQAQMREERSAELQAQQQRRAAVGDNPAIMSNMRVDAIYTQPCVEYWSNRA